MDAMTIDSQPLSAARGESSPNALIRACTSAGFELRRSSASRPRRVATPVPQPSTKTSLRSISAREGAVAVVGQVDPEAALAAGPELPRRVGAQPRAVGRLEQPHLGARVGEHLADDRGGQGVGRGDDTDAGERAGQLVGHLAHPSIVPVECQILGAGAAHP